MTENHLWERHVDKMVQKLLELLETKQYGETIFLKVDYSLRVIITGVEKIILLCILFGVAGYLTEFVAAFGVIIMLRSCTGGMHRKTISGCFFQSLLNLSLIICLGENIMLKKGVCVFIALILMVLILYFAPIQSENRIQYSEKQRTGFKVKALVRMTVILVSDICIPEELYNIMMFAVSLHMLEMLFLCVRIQKKEVVHVMHCIKQEINKQLCHMTKGIQENSSSNRLWGEVKLPECLRRELENPDRVIK